MKKILAIILIISLIMPTALIGYADENYEEFSDIKGHWAEDTLKKHHKMDMLSGYPDGTFKPDQQMKRSELITLVNKYFGLKEENNQNFEDVSGKEWYAKETAKAKYYGYINDLEARPKELASREDVVNMMSLILDVEEQRKISEKKDFKDLADIDEKEKENIEKFSQMGYISGYEDGSFKPKGIINRAEIMTIVENVLGYIVSSQADLDNMPEGVKKVTIINPNIIIENKEIKGDLYIAPGVNGKVTIKNTKIKGQIDVSGGTLEKPIQLENVEVEKVVITKVKNEPKVEIKGKSNIGEIKTKAKTELKLGEGTKVEKLIIEKETKVDTETGSKITNLEVKEKAEIKGQGTITKAEIKSKDVKLEKKPEYIKVDEKAGDTQVGKDKIDSKNDDGASNGGSSSNSGRGSSGKTSPGDTTPPVFTKKEAKLGDRTEEIKLSAETNEPANIYYILVETGSAPPTVEQVKTGTDYDGVTVLANGNKEIFKDEIITGLTEGKKYDIYLIAEDKNGNMTKETVKISITLPCFYKISKIEDLASIGGIHPKTGEAWGLDKNYILMNDLDFNSDTSYYDPDTTYFGDINGNGAVEGLKTELTTREGWKPIGNESSFTGIFDGNDFKIANLYIDRNDTHQGLFSKIQSGAIIQDLIIDGANIKCASVSGTLAGEAEDAVVKNCTIKNIKILNFRGILITSVGGLIGQSKNSTIYECTVEKGQIFIVLVEKMGGLVGLVNGGDIKNSHVENVTTECDDGGYIGGFLGKVMNGDETLLTIENCSVKEANVVGDGYIGGFIGIVDKKGDIKIVNSHVEGTMKGKERVGGFVGEMTGDGTRTIKNSYAKVDVGVKKSGDNNGYAGGFAGCLEGGDVQNCYATGNITSLFTTGGFVGAMGNSTASNCYAKGNVENVVLGGGFAGAMVDSTASNCYAIGDVKSQQPAGGFVGEIRENTTIEKCYASGTVLGGRLLGGLVGNASEHYSEPTDALNIIDCVAFNIGGVQGTNVDVNRIVGKEDEGITKKFDNNYAYKNMLVKENDAQKTGTSDSATIWGADLETFTDKESQPLSSWDFENVWEIKEGANRPTLKNVGIDDGNLVAPSAEIN